MGLRKTLRPIYSRVLVPLAKLYLRKTRHSRYQDVHVAVPTGVFHPGLYLSTRFMLRHLGRHSLAGMDLWEIGAGSGMVSIWCAKRGAHVIASDISTAAVQAIRTNAASNGVTMEVLEADLFEGMPARLLDWIVINPPYYPSNPVLESDHAFLCGADFQYFERLFAGLGAFCKPSASVRMVLSEDCAFARIEEIGRRNGWHMQEVDRMRKLGEWNYIYALTRESGTAQ
jgi:release factor glutamine methyltransferase